MNTGLQDAYNLAWKLALVIKGRAQADLLDSYGQERIPVAERLLRTTDRMFSLAVSDNRLAGLFRTRVLPELLAFAMKREPLRRLAFRTISQIGIRYRESPLSQTLPGLPKDAPRAGDRFPWMCVKLKPDAPAEDLFQKLRDTRFTLIVAGQPAPSSDAGLADLLDTVVIADDPDNVRELARVGVPLPSSYLLRPDGHVGLAGVALDAAMIAAYASERLQLGPL